MKRTPHHCSEYSSAFSRILTVDQITPKEKWIYFRKIFRKFGVYFRYYKPTFINYNSRGVNTPTS
jgi:hypothetical protein